MRDNAGSNRVFLEGKHERAITVADIVKSITDAVKIYHYPKAGDPIHSMKKDNDGVHVPHGVNFTVIITGVHNDNREYMYVMYIDSEGNPKCTKRIKRSDWTSDDCIIIDSFPYTSEKVPNFDLSKIDHIHSFKTNHDFTAFLDCNGPGGEVIHTSMKLERIKMLIELDGIRRKSDLGLAKIPANKQYL